MYRCSDALNLKADIHSANLSRSNDTFGLRMLFFRSPFEKKKKEIWINCKDPIFCFFKESSDDYNVNIMIT